MLCVDKGQDDMFGAACKWLTKRTFSVLLRKMRGTRAQLLPRSGGSVKGRVSTVLQEIRATLQLQFFISGPNESLDQPYEAFCCCCSAAQSCPILCDPMDCSIPGFPVLCCLPELAQTHVHWVDDAIQPSHPLSLPSAALNLSQHQGLFHWVI